MLLKLLREPLLHFAALAAVIFAGYGLLASRSSDIPPSSIVVSTGKIEQMSAIFARTWQRPPGPEELKGLIDDYVTEEIYVREALTLGLDKDDTVIRRRLRQKMEFMTSADVDALTPTEAELQAYLDAHASEFSEPPAVAFEQVFLNPDNHPGTEEKVAVALLASLHADPATDASQLGDGSLLPYDFPLTSLPRVSRVFSPEFADAVARAEPDIWSGPVASAYGLHLVRVTAKNPGRLPPLADIRDIVLREWSNAMRQDLEAARMEALLGRYEVRIGAAPASAAAP